MRTQSTDTTRRLLKIAFAAAALATSPLALAGGHEGGHADHSQHDMGTKAKAKAKDMAKDKAGEHAGHAGHGGGMSHADHAKMDEQGRRFYGMKHPIEGEIGDQLRERVPGLDRMDNRRLGLMMQAMGSNYEWYLSDQGVRADVGILIMSHGFGDHGDKVFKDKVAPIAELYPAAITNGMAMAMSDHIQYAVDDLTNAGAKHIIVIPVITSQHNTLLRQWQYILGKRDEPTYASVPRVKTDAMIHIAPVPGESPLMAEVMLDHALEKSENPAEEVVIMVGHGPTFAEDNAKELETMGEQAEFMRQDSEFADIKYITLQDDAPKPVRDANVATLRGFIEKAQADGKRVLIVTNLMGSRTIQGKLRRDLKGLKYTLNPKGLAQHPNFMEWMRETLDEQLDEVQLAAN